MLIAQLSDVHVRPAGQRYKDVADSNGSLREAIAHLHALDPRPDLVLITGDLVDEGRADEYANAAALLGELAIPFRLIPGNHDDRSALRTAFPAHTYLPEHGPMHHGIDDGPVRIVALDSTVPGRRHGEIDAAGLDWLRAALAADTTRPAIVVLHHPPFASGIAYLDRYRLRDPEPLAAVLRAFDHVEAVLCGHVHRTMMRRWAGTIVCAGPSTATEIALRLAPDAAPASYLGPRGFLLHRWTEADGLVSHVVDLGRYPGPFPFF
jgi:3',5'-cyclic AMP phosphodiesterase CpdA